MQRFLVAVLIFLPIPTFAAPVDSSDVRVIDGDTIRVYQQQPNVRLVGFNAPETRRAVCAAERKLGASATRRLRDLVRAGHLDFEFVACACPPGTEGTQTCNYGRRCGTLKANGRDVGDALIAEGFAVPFVCGATRCPPTPKPWCQQGRSNKGSRLRPPNLTGIVNYLDASSANHQVLEVEHTVFRHAQARASITGDLGPFMRNCQETASPCVFLYLSTAATMGMSSI